MKRKMKKKAMKRNERNTEDRSKIDKKHLHWKNSIRDQ